MRPSIAVTRRIALILIIVSIALIALGLRAFSSKSHHSSMIEPILSSSITPQSICGSWVADPLNTVTAAITSAGGPIARCQLIGYSWVILTEGVTDPPTKTPIESPTAGAKYTTTGLIATDTCSTGRTSCLTSSSRHRLTSWRASHFPRPEYLTPVALITPTVLELKSLDGTLFFFNLIQHTWKTAQSPILKACSQYWVNYQNTSRISNSATPLLALEQTFILAHPECTYAS